MRTPSLDGLKAIWGGDFYAIYYATFRYSAFNEAVFC